MIRNNLYLFITKLGAMLGCVSAQAAEAHRQSADVMRALAGCPRLETLELWHTNSVLMNFKVVSPDTHLFNVQLLPCHAGM